MANNAGLPTFLDMTTPMYNPMATPNYDVRTHSQSSYCFIAPRML